MLPRRLWCHAAYLVLLAAVLVGGVDPPTFAPTPIPTLRPTTALPTPDPTARPTAGPTMAAKDPTAKPTPQPTTPTAHPSAVPTMAPTSAEECGPFSVKNTNGDVRKQAMCGVTASAGQTFTVSTCKALYAKADCTGPTTLRVYSPEGVEVVYDDTGTGPAPPTVCISGSDVCAQVQYTVPAGTVKQTYLIQEGCVGMAPCTGIAVVSGAGVQLVTYAPTPRPTNPTAAPTVVPTTGFKEPSSLPTVAPTKRPSTHPTPAPSEKPTAKPTPHPTPAPSAIPSAGAAVKPEPSAAPSPRPSPHPTAPTPAPSAIPSAGAAVKPSPHPTAAPSTVAKPSQTTSPTTTVQAGISFKETVGQYRVGYKVTQYFVANTIGDFKTLVTDACAPVALPSTLPTLVSCAQSEFKVFLRSAILEALPKIGQTHNSAANTWSDNGRYFIDLSGPFWNAGQAVPQNSNSQDSFPILGFNYTVEFNGQYLSTLNMGDGPVTVFDTHVAYMLSKQILLENVNPASGGSTSEFQNTLNQFANRAVNPGTVVLLNKLVINDGFIKVGRSTFYFPTMRPTQEPTVYPTDFPTQAPITPAIDNGFSLAGGFAFLMSFSLFVFCYLQYCPGWIPGYDHCIGNSNNQPKIDKSEHAGLQVELGRPIDFEDLSEPDIRFGKGHAVKRASLLFDQTQQSLHLSGAFLSSGGTQGTAVMSMAQEMSGASSGGRRLSAARRGSALSSPSLPPPPPTSYDDDDNGGGGFSSSRPFASSLDPESANPLHGDSSMPPPPPPSFADSDAPAPAPAPAAPRPSASSRLSIKNLAAMKARKSVSAGAAPPPPPSDDA